MIETRFKYTEIGRIPEDWAIFSIGEHCSVKARIGWQGLKTDEYQEFGEFGLITSTDIIGGTINWATCHFVSKSRFEQDANIIVKEGDVLVSKDGTIGKVGIVQDLPFPSTLNSGVFVIRTKCKELSQKGLSLVFISPVFKDFVTRLTAGSTIVHLYQKDIVKFTFTLPSSDIEQSRIASALTSIDNLISSLDKLIEKKKNIKQGTMQQLLTGKKRLKGFSEPWVKETFEKIYSFASEGGTPSTSNSLYYNGTIPFAKIEDTERKYLDSTKITISESGLQNSSAWMILENNILFTNGATIGNVCINRIPVCTKQGILGLIIRNKYDVEFVYYLLSSIDFQKEVHSRETKGTFATIILKNMNEIPIFVPSTKAEQSAIAAILSSMDNEISALEAKKAKYESLKQGMMQQLLTGRIRLI